ncbi:MAG: Ribokinase [Firmicutes bacterium ADurb.Bin300]|nr:MAG: Ribokinase [Firmicutes bacterium ADurb.Bin300]
MSSKRIMVVGSANMDVVLRLAKQLREGECVMAHSQDVFPGGKGANRAVALARLGENPIFSCCIGNDYFAHILFELFESENIDTSQVFRLDNAGTGAAYIMLDNKGNNRIAVYPGANDLFRDKYIDTAKKSLSCASFLTLELEIPLESVERLNFAAQKACVPVVIDAGPIRMKTDKSIFKGAFLLSPNQSEAEALTGIKIKTENDIKEACKELYSFGVKYAHIKLGAKGSVCYDGKDFIFCKAFETGLPVVDTTAAGDSYMAAFCSALSRGSGIEKSMRFASVAAGISVTRLGAIPSLPNIAEIKERLN